LQHLVLKGTLFNSDWESFFGKFFWQPWVKGVGIQTDPMTISAWRLATISDLYILIIIVLFLQNLTQNSSISKIKSFKLLQLHQKNIPNQSHYLLLKFKQNSKVNWLDANLWLLPLWESMLLEMCPDTTQPEHTFDLWSWYFLTSPAEIFFDLKGKNWKIWDF